MKYRFEKISVKSRFISLINLNYRCNLGFFMWGSVKEQHFDNSLQEIFSEDYLIIGKLFGMYGFANLILLWHNWDKLFMDFDRYINICILLYVELPPNRRLLRYFKVLRTSPVNLRNERSSGGGRLHQFHIAATSKNSYQSTSR